MIVIFKFIIILLSLLYYYHYYYYYYYIRIGSEGWFGFLDLWSVKNLTEQIFNSCREFRWSSEGPVSQIHSHHLHAGAHGIFSDFLRSVQMLKREWSAESNGKLPHLFIPSKTATWFLSLQWKSCLWAELLPWYLRLQWRTCPWAEHPDDDDELKNNISKN